MNENSNFDFYWFEAKQLDRVTNYSTETEIIGNLLKSGINAHYYCTFKSTKKFYGLPDNIHYLGIFRNKYLKFLEFHFLVIFAAAFFALRKKPALFMTNQTLACRMFLARWISTLLGRKHAFTVDIRTLPIAVSKDDPAMKKYCREFSAAAKHCRGFSFITPFIGEITREFFPDIAAHPTVYWSSGVDLSVFNAEKFSCSRKKEDVFRIFYHGGMGVNRGTLDLIKACENLKKEGLSIELVLIGIVVDPLLNTYVKEHHLEDFCHILPPMPLADIPQEIACSDLAVMPFPYYLIWRTSSPIKLMEYLAMGKPVLVPDQECFTDVFGKNGMDGVTYYNAQASDLVAELTNALRGYIAQTPMQKETPCLPHLIQFVSNGYTWKQQAEKIAAWSQQLLSGIEK